MKTLKDKYALLVENLSGLQKVLEHDCEYGGKECKIRQDGEIKRFEYTFDILTDFLKTYLRKYHAVTADSIKDIFKECQSTGITTGGETNLLIEMADMRNETRFAYEGKVREHALEKIPEYHECMASVTLKTKLNK